VQHAEIKREVLDGYRRLAARNLVSAPEDSLSLRIPGERAMMILSGVANRAQAEIDDVRLASFAATGAVSAVHAHIYEERGDVGAVVISTPHWTRILSSHSGSLPPLFDEQVRHIGPASLPQDDGLVQEAIGKSFRRGTNAALLGGRLICLGMTRDRLLFNVALYEKCAQAWVMAKASGGRIGRIPFWVRLIATRRLLKDEARALASYREGRIPEAATAY
jgi:ribulose-5-phosphate 4-epimerase/fuculose-1-phosphate aldolase